MGSKDCYGEEVEIVKLGVGVCRAVTVFAFPDVLACNGTIANSRDYFS